MSRVALFCASLIGGAAAFQPTTNGAFTPAHGSASFRGINRPALRKSVTGPVMFETKIFKKETFDFSVAPDPTSEDILRVRTALSQCMHVFASSSDGFSGWFGGRPPVRPRISQKVIVFPFFCGCRVAGTSSLSSRRPSRTSSRLESSAGAPRLPPRARSASLCPGLSTRAQRMLAPGVRPAGCRGGACCSDRHAQVTQRRKATFATSSRAGRVFVGLPRVAGSPAG